MYHARANLSVTNGVHASKDLEYAFTIVYASHFALSSIKDVAVSYRA